MPGASSDAVATTSAGARTLMVRLAVALLVAESVTRAVNVEDPAAEGVPEIVPDPLSARPAGSEPDATDHAYGGVPPDALRVWL